MESCVFTTPEHSWQKMHLPPNMLHSFPLDALGVDLVLLSSLLITSLGGSLFTVDIKYKKEVVCSLDR